MSLSVLAAAQDTLNASIKTAVESFLEDPAVNLQHGQITAYRDPSGELVVNVTTTIDAVIDNARITRTAPQN